MAKTNCIYNEKEAADNLFKSTQIITNKKWMRPQVVKDLRKEAGSYKDMIRWL